MVGDQAIPGALLQARKDVEGSLFLKKRRTHPTYQFTILNKKSQCEASPGYLLHASPRNQWGTGNSDALEYAVLVYTCDTPPRVPAGNYSEELSPAFTFEEQNSQYLLYRNVQNEV